MSSKSNNNQDHPLEKLKVKTEFDAFIADQIMEKLPEKVRDNVDIDLLVDGVKKRVNPKVLDAGENWDQD